MASSAEYWTWDPQRKDYYHSEKDPLTGNQQITWATPQTSSTPRVTNTSTPYSRSPPQTQPRLGGSGPLPQPLPKPLPQPLEPYGLRNYVHGSAGTSLAQITQGVAQLSTSQGNAAQTHYGRSGQTSETRVNVPSARPGQRQSTYYPTRASSLANAQLQNFRPHAYTVVDNTQRPPMNQSPFAGPPQGLGHAAGKLPAQNLSGSGQWLPTFQRSDQSNDTQYAQALQASRATYAKDQVARGSSKEAQASSASHRGSGVPVSMSRDNDPGFDNVRQSKLDHEYFKRSNPKDFFIIGKVFMMLHTEAASGQADHGSHGGFSTVAYGEVVYSQVRRFVVVRERPNENYCSCLPITTYNSRGTEKKGVDQKSHTMVYTGEIPPQKLKGETKMVKEPIRVVAVRADEKLDELSRINLGKAYPVEHNVKVKEIGHVHERSLPKLISYFKSSR